VTKFVETVVIGSSLRNGRVYFNSKDSSLFPSDSYGDREEDGKRGIPVEFIAGPHNLRCDIRRLSGNRIGPRSSFAAYFKSVRAEEGKKLRITNVGERKYKVEYLG
jgi:hypothetical protein